MSGEASGAEAYLYVISCGLERAKIGVAGDARKRLRELQVGSPVELKLELTRAYAERRDANAVAEELYRHFARRRDRGSWYRLSKAEVRGALPQPATVEAPARARAAAEAAARERRVAPRRGERLRARTQKQLAYERRRRQQRTRKQKRAAKLLGQGMTQQAVAAELRVADDVDRDLALHRLGDDGLDVLPDGGEPTDLTARAAHLDPARDTERGTLDGRGEVADDVVGIADAPIAAPPKIQRGKARSRSRTQSTGATPMALPNEPV